MARRVKRLGPNPQQDRGWTYNLAMLELSRTVRFCLNDPEEGARGAQAPERHNGFSAWPPMRGLGRFYELEVHCVGEADRTTGYFINITHIDAAVREHLLPYLAQTLAAATRSAAMPMGTLLGRMLEQLQPPLDHTVARLALKLTPMHSLEIRRSDMNHIVMRQQFEFSAAHRLHVAELSDEENRRIFGKCNNPSGHGHNYKLEVAVRAPIGATGQALRVEDLDALVDAVVVQKFDHKHLNVDVPQFAHLNPSVENITVVIYDMLSRSVGGVGAMLDEVSVWETTKTVCTYRGE